MEKVWRPFWWKDAEGGCPDSLVAIATVAEQRAEMFRRIDVKSAVPAPTTLWSSLLKVRVRGDP